MPHGTRTGAKDRRYSTPTLTFTSWVARSRRVPCTRDLSVSAIKDIPATTQGTTGVIGSAVKCCWCCAWLAEHLARHTDPHQTFTFKFHVAGSHGRIDPWAPPTGVPSAVLEELTTVLQEKLSSALKLKTYDPTAEGVASDRRHGGPASTTTDEEIFMSYASNPAHDE